MILLHPVPASAHRCPYCNTKLHVAGWYMPGMRSLAELTCGNCAREFFGDLGAGQALYTPMLMEKAGGAMHGAARAPWFASWLQSSYSRRTDTGLKIDIEEMRPIKQALLLNCLDAMYGHCLLKLLNAQYCLDQYPEYDLIVMVPGILRWLVPEGVAAIWSIDLPLSRGAEWNDWLAKEIGRRVAEFEKCWLSIAISHPHPTSYRIERFTRVVPFALEQWVSRRPTVTFIWRDDRLWSLPAGGGRWTRLKRFMRRGFISRLEDQQQRMTKFAKALKKQIPDLDLAVAGVAQPGGLPQWITDLRRPKVDAALERTWCERYAASHCVVGVHGSNMLLPSAHAGATVELMPAKHWGNILQEILFRNEDLRTAVFRHRILPIDTDPLSVAAVVGAVISTYPDFATYMAPESVSNAVLAALG